MTLVQKGNEFPLGEMPAHERQGFFATGMVLLGFTFFTGTMFAGAEVGVAFPVRTLLWLALLANLLLALYAAALGQIAARSGLNTVLMGRFCFGEAGSRIADFILGFAELGWYAWGTATMALTLVKVLHWPNGLAMPLMALFGAAFCLTALAGFKGLDRLARVSIPVMLLLLLVAMGIATRQAGGWQGMLRIQPSQHLNLAEAVTVIFGTFASGATQATNWSRQAANGKSAAWASLLAFLFGNGLMVVAGAWCAMVYQQADIVAVLMLQGLSVAALVMLGLNLWTIQGPTIYNVSAAACHFFRSANRRGMTLLSAAAGIALAMAGMADALVPFLKLLGSIIPPIGGVILADYWLLRAGRYPLLAEARLARFNYPGLAAYGVGALTAYFSPWVAPLVGIALSTLVYLVLSRLLGHSQALAGADQPPGAGS